MGTTRTKGRRGRAAKPNQAAATSARPWRPALWYLALLLGTLLAYRPVWHGGFLWDDDAHVIVESLRTWSGLGQLWTDFTVSQQYYPVASTAFWLMAKLWGSDTVGYHVVNIALHATSAFLVTLILRRLRVPGAILAGAVFALHPVYVESVAWISELKNTLSGVCYLGALLAYLKFDETRRSRLYAAAFALFVLALGTKTVTVTLPAAILVIFWWRRGRLDWRQDVLPLMPFFAVGIASGLMTAWLEYHWVGAKGAQFGPGFGERLLLAGRVPWFYALTLVWPVNLMFNYPRWTIDASAWWQYLYPIASAGAVAALVAFRHRSRAPLAAALFFIGTLFPALGLFNVYPFRYSFVADHFQYLASLGVIAGISAGVTLALRRWPGVSPLALAAVVAAPLAVLTYQQSRQYADAETLYRETIVRNPASALARTNLASRLLDGPASGWPEAMELARGVLAFDPDNVAAHNLFGLSLQQAGRLEESRRELERAVQLDPGLAEAHYNLGLTLDGLGRLEEAAAAYRQSLAIYPKNVKALHNHANVLRQLKRYDEALAGLRSAIAIDPDAAEVRLNLADTLHAKGDLAGAVAAYQDAIGRRPDWGEAWNNLGMTLRRMGRAAEARQAFERAVQFVPDAPIVYANLAAMAAEAGQGDEAVKYYDQALGRSPDSPQTAQWHNDAGVVLARLGRPAEAVAHFEAALRIRPDFAEARGNLARIGRR